MNRNELKCIRNPHSPNKFIFIHLNSFINNPIFKNYEDIISAQAWQKKSAKLPHKIIRWADISP